MPPSIYHILHFIGILMLFLGYGALLGRSMAGSGDARVKKLGSITSGIGLVLMIIAGFGLVAKLYGNVFQGWMFAKVGIWFLLGGLIALINRKPALAVSIWWGLIALGGIAAVMVYIRPF
ncbi:MAG: hypothetical protein ACI81V_000871 [Lentimonas sp.]|jgi:hypothetical protein